MRKFGRDLAGARVIWVSAVIGYEARDLSVAIRAALGIDRPWRAVLVGVGNLAPCVACVIRASGLRGSKSSDCSTRTPTKVGQVVEGLEVESVDRLESRLTAFERSWVS